MTNTFKLKRRTSGAAGSPASLKSGELAHNETENILYIGKGDDGGGTAVAIVPVAGTGAFSVLGHEHTLADIADAGTAAALNITVSSTEPASPAAGDLWIDDGNAPDYGVLALTQGHGVTVDATDPAHPVVKLDSSLGDLISAADQTKLNAIEVGATADQTAAEILTALKTVDGPGSGLEADKLDGLEGSAYQIKTANGLLSGFRNKIINGDFFIAQRGTVSAASGYVTADRWFSALSGSTRTSSVVIFAPGQTDVPGNPRAYIRNAVTSVAGAGNFAQMLQYVEGVSTLAGKQATLTFYAKADAVKKLGISFAQLFGSGGSADNVFGVQAVALTTAWQRFDLSISIPSLAGKTIGSNAADTLTVAFWFDAGTTYAGMNALIGQQSGSFDIAHVSLVEGDASEEADPFSPRHSQQELALCQRYYETGYSIFSGDVTADGVYYAYSSFNVAKRVAPTVSIITTSQNLFPAGSPSVGQYGGGVRGNKAASTTGTTGFYDYTWVADAEL